MAISKILHMKDNGSYHGKHLKQAIDYILKEEKTQEHRLVGSSNCQLSYAFEQMKATKQHFGKVDKRQGYHIIISFKEGEIDADRAFAFVTRFVDEYLGKEYEAVYAVHDNTDHIHAHIIFNSVSFLDGHKYRYKKGDWARYIQPVTNRLCEEFGLSTIELDEDVKAAKRGSGAKQKSENRGNGTQDETAIPETEAQEKEAGSAARTKGWESSTERYERKRTEARIISFDVKRYPKAKLSGMQRHYYTKLYATGQLIKKPYAQAWKYRDDIRKMQRLQEQYLFLVRHDVNSLEELAAVTASLADKKKEISGERSRVSRERSRHASLFAAADEMKKLRDCEMCYRDGDEYFADEHMEWKAFEQKLKELGYTLEEAEELREQFRSEYARVFDMDRAVTKELRLAESIRKDFIGSQELTKEDLEQMKDNPEWTKEVPEWAKDEPEQIKENPEIELEAIERETEEELRDMEEELYEPEGRQAR